MGCYSLLDGIEFLGAVRVSLGIGSFHFCQAPKHSGIVLWALLAFWFILDFVWLKEWVFGRLLGGHVHGRVLVLIHR